jgi:hypothetical protein
VWTTLLLLVVVVVAVIVAVAAVLAGLELVRHFLLLEVSLIP